MKQQFGDKALPLKQIMVIFRQDTTQMTQRSHLGVFFSDITDQIE